MNRSCRNIVVYNITQSQAFDNFNCEPGSCFCKTVASLQAKWETANFCNWEPQNISSQDNLSILLSRSKTVLRQHCNAEPGFNTTSSAKVCSAKFEHRYFLYTVTPDYHFFKMILFIRISSPRLLFLSVIGLIFIHYCFLHFMLSKKYSM